MFEVEMGKLMAMIYLNKTDCESGAGGDRGKDREIDKDK